MRHETPHQKGEHGQSLVELAVSFTLLILMVAGTVDLGRAYFAYNALRDSAQEGAAFGSLDPTDTAGIQARVYDNLKNIVVASEGQSIPPEAVIEVNVIIFGDACLGSTIQVDVNYLEYPLTMPFLGTIIGQDYIPLHATIQDTILRPTCGQ